MSTHPLPETPYSPIRRRPLHKRNKMQIHIIQLLGRPRNRTLPALRYTLMSFFEESRLVERFGAFEARQVFGVVVEFGEE